jgi:hypothetical protein
VEGDTDREAIERELALVREQIEHLIPTPDAPHRTEAADAEYNRLCRLETRLLEQLHRFK